MPPGIQAPPSGVNMQPILEALARRQQGSLGGGGVPMAQQSTPGAPTQSAPQMPVSPLGSMPHPIQQPTADNAAPTNSALQAGQKAQAPMFDEQTRTLAKSLVQRLLQGI